MALAGGGTGNRAAGRDDRAVLRGSVGGGVGASSLVEAGTLTAWGAAVALSAIAVHADEEHCVALATEANSLPEYRFALNRRHAPSQAGLDNGTGFVAGWNQLSLVLPVERSPNSEPCRSNGRVPSASRL